MLLLKLGILLCFEALPSLFVVVMVEIMAHQTLVVSEAAIVQMVRLATASSGSNRIEYILRNVDRSYLGHLDVLETLLLSLDGFELALKLLELLFNGLDLVGVVEAGLRNWRR